MAGVTSQIRMSLDSSGIVSGANTASRALDELRQKLEAAQSKGDWSEAAKITQEIAHMQNPGFSAVMVQTCKTRHNTTMHGSLI